MALTPPHASFRSLPAQARLLVAGTLINHAGIVVGPFLALVAVEKLGMTLDRARFVVGAYAFGTFAAVLAGGWLTDLVGRRRTLLASLFGGGATALALAALPRPGLLAPLVLVFGFIGELFRPAAAALLAESASSSQRATAFAANRVAMNLGYACAMAVGGLLMGWNWRSLFVFDGVTTLGFAALALVAVEEPRRASPRPASGGPSPWADPVFRVVLLTGLSLALFYTSYISMFPLTVTRAAGYSDRVVGLLLAVKGAMVVLFELPVVEAARGRRRLRVSAFGALLMAAGLGATGLIMHWAWFLAMLVVWSSGEILCFSLLASFHSDWAPPESRGRYLSLTQANWRVAQALNPVLFMPLFESLSPARFWAAMACGIVPSIFLFLLIDRRFDRPELLRGLAAEGA